MGLSFRVEVEQNNGNHEVTPRDLILTEKALDINSVLFVHEKRCKLCPWPKFYMETLSDREMKMIFWMIP